MSDKITIPLNAPTFWANMLIQVRAFSGGQMITYKVVEINTVSEEMLEETLNEWTAKGWRFDGIQFAMRESSKRPSMAFVIFTREEGK